MSNSTELSKLWEQCGGESSTMQKFFSCLSKGEDNPLKDYMANQIVKELSDNVKQRIYSAGELVIKECLTAIEQDLLVENFPEIKLFFRGTVKHDHAYAKASRSCEHKILKMRANYDSKTDYSSLCVQHHKDTYLKEIGGNFMNTIKENCNHYHTCSPIIDGYDSSRFTTRKQELDNYPYRSDVTEFGITASKFVRSAWNSGVGNRVACFDKSQDCNVTASVIISLHSNYDMTPVEYCDAMDVANCDLAYGSFVFHPKILMEETGIIEGLNMKFVRSSNERCAKGDSKIEFGFKNSNSYNYVHNFENYISWVLLSSVKSSKGHIYNLELLENRSGIQFFRITKNLTGKSYKSINHKVYLDHLENKLMVTFFDIDSTIMHQGLRRKLVSIWNDPWEGLDHSRMKLSRFLVDKSLVYRTMDFVRSATEEKFKPEQIISFLRSIGTRRVFNGTVVTNEHNLTPDQLAMLACSIYIVMYDSKFRMGKVIQQMISDLNHQRKYISSNVIAKCFLNQNDVINNRSAFNFIPKFLRKSKIFSFFTSYKRQLLPPLLIQECPEYMTGKEEYFNCIDSKVVMHDFNYEGFTPISSIIRNVINKMFDSKFKDIVYIPLRDYSTKVVGFGPENIIYKELKDELDSLKEKMRFRSDDYYEKFLNAVTPPYSKEFKSRAQAKIHEIMDHIGLHPIKALDLCANPGGFVDELLSRGAEVDYHQFVNDTIFMKSNSAARAKCLNVNGGNLLNDDYTLVSNSLTDKEYDLITCDGAIITEEQIEEDHLPLLYNQMSLALEHVAVNGSIILKGFNFLLGQSRAIIEKNINKFGRVVLYRSSFTRAHSGELYVIFVGFRREPKTNINDLRKVIINTNTNIISTYKKFLNCSDVPLASTESLTVSGDSDYFDSEPNLIGDNSQSMISDSTISIQLDPVVGEDLVVDLINQTDVVKLAQVESNEDTKLNMEKEKQNNCCFRAITECRIVDYTFMRNKLRSLNPDDQELCEETIVGAMAGDTTIRYYSEYYGVSVNIYDNDNKLVRSIDNPDSFRTINVKYNDLHYEYLPEECYNVGPRYSVQMFYPFKLNKFLADLKSMFTITVINNINEVKDDQVSFLNNLNNVCFNHSECSHNNLKKIIKDFDQIDSVGKLIVIMEDHYDIMELDMVLSGTNVRARVICCNVKGYYVFMLYKSSTPSRLNRAVKELRDHKEVCDNCTPKYAYFDHRHDIWYNCKSKGILINYEIPLNYDIKFNIITTNKAEVAITKININTYQCALPAIDGDLIIDASVLKVIKETTSRLLLPHYVLFLSIEEHHVSPVIGLFSEMVSFIYIDPSQLSECDSIYSPDYIGAINDIEIRYNSMIEVYSLWQYEKKSVEYSLKENHEKAVRNLELGVGLGNISDSSFVLLDLERKEFFPTMVTTYDWGFNGFDLISTTSLFNFDSLNKNTCREFAKRYRYLSFNNRSKLVHGVTLAIKFSNIKLKVEDVPQCHITFVQGIPGAGKSQYILNQNKTSKTNFILTVTKEGCNDLRRRAKLAQIKLPSSRISTIDALLVHRDYSSFGYVETVWIDEALLVHSGVWLWIAYITACKNLVLVGDNAQIPYIERSGCKVRYSNPKFSYEEKFLSTTYRCPLDVTLWMNKHKFYETVVDSVSTIERSVKLIKIQGLECIPINKNVKYLVFKQSEKQKLKLKGYDVNTVHEFQGNQQSTIWLVRLEYKEADKIYESLPHILVALTRHTESFVYYTMNDSDATSRIINKINGFSLSEIRSVKRDRLRGGRDVEMIESVTPENSEVLYYNSKTIIDTVVRHMGCGYNGTSFRKLWLFADPVPLTCNIVLDNDIQIIQGFFDYVRPGASCEDRTYDYELLEESPLITEGDAFRVCIIPSSTTLHATLSPTLLTSVQHRVPITQKNVIRAFFDRNGNVPQLQGLVSDCLEAELLAKSVLSMIKPSTLETYRANPIIIGPKNLNEWLYTQPPAIKAILDSCAEDIYDTNLTSYEFALKAISKINLDPEAEFVIKQPQTIAYQSKVVNALFCPVLKEMMNRYELGFNDNILLYNSMSPIEFCDLMNTVMPNEKCNRLNKFLEIDFSKYDKSQNLLALIFECILMEAIGVEREYVTLWIYMHKRTRLIDRKREFSAFVDYQRKSGDAGTWRLNTLFELAVLMRSFNLEKLLQDDKCVILCSGDDSLIFLESIPRYTDTIIGSMQYVYNLEAKRMSFDIPYFCSKFLINSVNGWIFVPDLLKLIIKLGRSDLVDFVHVEEYRVSFLDNLYYYKDFINYQYISAAIRDRYKVIGDFDVVYEALLSVASTESAFKKLYYKGQFYKERSYSKRPNLDI